MGSVMKKHLRLFETVRQGLPKQAMLQLRTEGGAAVGSGWWRGQMVVVIYLCPWCSRRNGISCKKSWKERHYLYKKLRGM